MNRAVMFAAGVATVAVMVAVGWIEPGADNDPIDRAMAPILAPVWDWGDGQAERPTAAGLPDSQASPWLQPAIAFVAAGGVPVQVALIGVAFVAFFVAWTRFGRHGRLIPFIVASAVMVGCASLAYPHVVWPASVPDDSRLMDPIDGCVDCIRPRPDIPSDTQETRP